MIKTHWEEGEGVSRDCASIQSWKYVSKGRDRGCLCVCGGQPFIALLEASGKREGGHAPAILHRAWRGHRPRALHTQLVLNELCQLRHSSRQPGSRPAPLHTSPPCSTPLQPLHIAPATPTRPTLPHIAPDVRHDQLNQR